MAKDTFDRARDFVEEKIDQTKEVLGDSYSRAREQFDDISGDVRKTARRLEKDYGYLFDDVREYIRDNPGTAIGISLGIGFLFGYLFRGRDD